MSNLKSKIVSIGNVELKIYYALSTFGRMLKSSEGRKELLTWAGFFILVCGIFLLLILFLFILLLLVTGK